MTSVGNLDGSIREINCANFSVIGLLCIMLISIDFRRLTAVTFPQVDYAEPGERPPSRTKVRIQDQRVDARPAPLFHAPYNGFISEICETAF